jgi:hypothetical protein
MVLFFAKGQNKRETDYLTETLLLIQNSAMIGIAYTDAKSTERSLMRSGNRNATCSNHSECLQNRALLSLEHRAM